MSSGMDTSVSVGKGGSVGDIGGSVAGHIHAGMMFIRVGGALCAAVVGGR